MLTHSLPRIYGITDSGLLPTTDQLTTAVETAILSGVSWIQYRAKHLDPDTKLKQAERLMALCQTLNAVLIVNDDVHLAQRIRAHGVHLGQSDMPVGQARAILGPEVLIGVTCHSDLALARKAADEGASYLAFGRFFRSRTKPNAPVAPLSVLQKAKTQFQLPIVAIGGIDATNALEVYRAGADGLACCNSLFDGNNVKSRAEMLFRSLSHHE